MAQPASLLDTTKCAIMVPVRVLEAWSGAVRELHRKKAEAASGLDSIRMRHSVDELFRFPSSAGPQSSTNCHSSNGFVRTFGGKRLEGYKQEGWDTGC